MEVQTNGDRTCGILTTPDERNNHGPCQKGAEGTLYWKRESICQEGGSTHLWRRASSEETGRRHSLQTGWGRGRLTADRRNRHCDIRGSGSNRCIHRRRSCLRC